MTSESFLQIQIADAAITQLYALSNGPITPIHLRLTSRTEGISFHPTVRLTHGGFVCLERDNLRSRWDNLCSLLAVHGGLLKAYLTGHVRVKCRVASADAPPPYDGLYALELRWDGVQEDAMHHVEWDSRRPSETTQTDTQDLLPTTWLAKKVINKLTRRMPSGLPPRPANNQKVSFGKAVSSTLAQALHFCKDESHESTEHNRAQTGNPRRHANSGRRARPRSELVAGRHGYQSLSAYGGYVSVERGRRSRNE